MLRVLETNRLERGRSKRSPGCRQVQHWMPATRPATRLERARQIAQRPCGIAGRNTLLSQHRASEPHTSWRTPRSASSIPRAASYSFLLLTQVLDTRTRLGIIGIGPDGRSIRTDDLSVLRNA